MILYITIGLIFAFGTLYAVINEITPIMVSEFMESFFKQFGNENIFTMDSDCECNQGLLEDGSRCLVCGAFPESPGSKINDITDINEAYKAKTLKADDVNTSKSFAEPNQIGDRPPMVFEFKKEKSNSVNF